MTPTDDADDGLRRAGHVEVAPLLRMDEPLGNVDLKVGDHLESVRYQVDQIRRVVVVGHAVVL